MSDRVPLVLAIDVEPDERYPDPSDPRPWAGFERLVPALDSLRRKLTLVTGVRARFSWFLRMDPQIETVHGSAAFAAERYDDVLSHLRELGDDIGVHPHPQRWDGKSWLMDHGDDAWIEHSVRLSFAAYRDAFGEPCRLHRGGDRMMTSGWMRLLGELGVEVDMTPEPGEPGVDAVDRGARWTGSIPDYSDAPREAFVPSPGDFLSSNGRGAPVVLPLTSTRVPRSDRRRSAPGALPPGRPHRTLQPWHCDDPHELWDLASSWLDEMERPYLAFAIRSDITSHEPEWRRFEAVFKRLASHPLRDRIAVTPALDAAVSLGFSARSG